MVREKRKYRILLIEDNPDDIALTQEALCETGFDIALECARDGIEGIAFMRKSREEGTRLPDIVLLDLNLPRCSGLEFLAQMKEDCALMSVPVIVLTTSRSGDDVRRSFELHANSYIVKPVDMNEFIAQMKTLTEYWFRISVLPEVTP